MADTIKEIAQRVALIDLVKDTSKTFQTEEKAMADCVTTVVRNTSRALMRVAGDLEVTLGIYLALTNHEYLPQSIALTSAGVAMYVLDHYIFDRTKER